MFATYGELMPRGMFMVVCLYSMQRCNFDIKEACIILYEMLWRNLMIQRIKDFVEILMGVMGGNF